VGPTLGASLTGPLWRRSPVNLLRWPELFVAVLASAAVLGLASSIAPPFLSSASSAAFLQIAGEVESALAGVTVTEQVSMSPNGLQRRTEALNGELGDLHGLRPVVTTIVGDTVTLQTPEAKVGTTGRLITRTRALENIDVVDGGTGAGVWVSDDQAESLNADVGDRMKMVGRFRGSVSARITGIYTGLAATPVTDYWRPLYSLIYSSTGDAIPPAFVIVRPQLFERIGTTTAHGFGRFAWTEARWEYRLDAADVSVEEARTLKAAIDRVAKDVAAPGGPQSLAGDGPADGTGGGSPLDAFRFANTNTLLPDLIEESQATVGGIRLPLVLMSIAASLVALAMIGAAGAFSVRRRRAETMLLATRGVGAVAFGIRSAVEAFLPLALGATLGWLASGWIVELLGPSPQIDDGARLASLLWMAAAFVVAFITLGLAAGAAARRETESMTARTKLRVKGPIWEAVLLALAALCYAALVARTPSSTGQSVSVDALVIVFPVLLITGGAGLGARSLGRWLPRLRNVGGGLRPAPYLALRRLAAARRLALLLIAGVALATGVLVYSGALARSVEATSVTKSQVATGSDFAGQLQLAAPVPTDLPFPATVVQRVQQVQLAPSGALTEVLVVDTSTFEEAAFWNGGFSDSSLDDLLDGLDGSIDSGLPVVVVGNAQLDDGDFLRVLSSDIPLTISGLAEAWPGMHSGLITLVASRDAVERLQESGRSSLVGAAGLLELWAKGGTQTIADTLDKRDVGVTLVHTAEEARTTPSLLAAGWTLGFLQAVGAGAGLIAIAGVVMYLQARARAGVISWALSRRMGLKPWSFRASIALEVAAMLLISLAMGTALALVAAVLVYRRFDFLPSLPPEPVFAAPVATVAVALGALLLAAAIAGLRTHRFARRSNVAETLRTSG
jgi:putative ABC transport system permease protein